MKAPEKIYIRRIWGSLAASKMNITGSDIEYTRTDSFIEKATEWLKRNADDYTWYDEMEGESGMTDEFIEDFKEYLKK